MHYGHPLPKPNIIVKYDVLGRTGFIDENGRICNETHWRYYEPTNKCLDDDILKEYTSRTPKNKFEQKFIEYCKEILKNRT